MFILAETGEWALPRPATLDVDFGISLGASAGPYGTLATDLRAQGFRPSDTQSCRFERAVGSFIVYVDFMVENGDQPRGTRLVDDVPASVMPGVVRALQTTRRMPVVGTEAAITAFAADASACNPAMPDARRAIQTLFTDENAPGPVKAAHFVYGPVTAGESADTRLRRLQLRQDVLSVTAAFMAAGTQ